MIDQLKIGAIGSFDKFGASVRERRISNPKKKVIKDTVAFSNKTYDFSKINGELYWEERPLEYIFEILADTPEKLEEKKQAFLSWLMNVQEEKLYDPFIKDFHFVATYDDSDTDDSEIEKSTIKVIFTAYPYKIANHAKTYTTGITPDGETSIEIENKSSHRIVPTFKTDVALTLKHKNTTYSISAGTTSDEDLCFEPGKFTVTARSTSKEGELTVEFIEEVF